MTAYETASAQVGDLTESEFNAIEERIALAQSPEVEPLTDEELDAMEREYLASI